MNTSIKEQLEKLFGTTKDREDALTLATGTEQEKEEVMKKHDWCLDFVFNRLRNSSKVLNDKFDKELVEAASPVAFDLETEFLMADIEEIDESELGMTI